MTTFQSQNLHTAVAKMLRYAGLKNAKCRFNKELQDFEIHVKGISDDELKDTLSAIWSLYKRTDINILN
jgi:hypothetical protein